MTEKPAIKSKVLTLSAAVSQIADGDHVAIGGAALHMHPMAFIRELIRQGKRDLTVLGEIQGIEVDLLAGAGALRRVESAGVGLERFGLARNFRRAVENGELVMADYSDTMAMDRILAKGENLTFWPVSFIGGTDIPRYLDDLVEFDCPVTGRKLYAMPPARVDVAVIHMPYADERGNVLITERRLMPQSQDLVYARAADRTYVTVEHIVDHDFIRRNPHLNHLPAFQVTGVIEAPWGAHPGSMPDFYDYDEGHMEEYAEASKAAGTFAAYLRRYVHDAPDEAAYLEQVGVRNLLSARKIVL
jgi:glutaconate CoA-transferase subunit A